MRPARILAAALAAALAATAANAGTFLFIRERSQRDVQTDSSYVEPFSVVHSPAFSSSTGGNQLLVPICVIPAGDPNGNANNPTIVKPLQAAIAMWNALTPTQNNCDACTSWESGIQLGGQHNMFSTLLHELGHCALGLGHVNHREYGDLDPGPTPNSTGQCDVDGDGCCGQWSSFTDSVNSTAISSINGVRGDLEDIHQTCPVGSVLPPPAQCPRFGAPCPSPATCCPSSPGPFLQLRNIAWFRRADNNPFVIDATVIDRNSYSRATGQLPANHNFPASANKQVAAHVSHLLANTQSVMYARGERSRVYEGLAADDVNMVKYELTGIDRTAATADDYTLLLEYVTDCSSATIQVTLGTPVGDTNTAECAADIFLSVNPPTDNVKHYSIFGSLFLIPTITLNSVLPWEDSIPIFLSNMETGAFNEWSAVEPP
jgi:hypothetical protein